MIWLIARSPPWLNPISHWSSEYDLFSIAFSCVSKARTNDNLILTYLGLPPPEVFVPLSTFANLYPELMAKPKCDTSCGRTKENLNLRIFKQTTTSCSIHKVSFLYTFPSQVHNISVILLFPTIWHLEEPREPLVDLFVELSFLSFSQSFPIDSSEHDVLDIWWTKMKMAFKTYFLCFIFQYQVVRFSDFSTLIFVIAPFARHCSNQS